MNHVVHRCGIAVFASMAFAVSAANPQPASLQDTIAALDSAVFDAFNRCADPAQLQAHAAHFATDVEFSTRILAPFEFAGVERWDDSAVILRGRFKVQPIEQWNVRREFLRRLKDAFDREAIEIPFPHLTVYAGADRQGAAPPFRLAGVAALEGAVRQ